MSSRHAAQQRDGSITVNALAEFVRDACFVVDADGVVIAANEQAARLYDYVTGELAGMSLGDIFAGESEDELAERIETARKGPLLYSATHLTESGEAIPVEVDLKWFPAGGRQLLLAQVRDIAEGVGLEEELHLRSSVFDAALDAIIVHDFEGNLVLANSTAAADAGMTHEKFMALGPWGWLGEEARNAIDVHLETLRQKGSHVFESIDTRADGSTSPVEVHARLLQLKGRTVVVAVGRDIGERAAAMEAMRRMALSDPLTGLGNRAHLIDALARAIADARRHGDVLGVLFIDLDDFKPINDRFGHAAGDQVLIDLAKRLGAGVRRGDTVARMGGDEFAIILPRLSGPGALIEAAGKIAKCVSESTTIAGEPVSVTSSIGGALFEAEGDDADTLLAKADTAMYQAKRSGEAWRVWTGEDL